MISKSQYRKLVYRKLVNYSLHVYDIVISQKGKQKGIQMDAFIRFRDQKIILVFDFLSFIHSLHD